MQLNSTLLFDFPHRDPVDDSEAFARMQEVVASLGLTIERARIRSDVVVIDHIEHAPSPN
jgi:uncharacterized protein (TIGR03435 family)